MKRELLKEVKNILAEATDQSWLACVKEAREKIAGAVADGEEPICDIDDLLMDCNRDNWDAIIAEINTKIDDALAEEG